jgi:hypothetical protein
MRKTAILRQVLRPVAVAAMLSLAGVQGALAAAYESLFPLLISLPGWQAETPEGMDVKAAGGMTVTANRTYTRDPQIFSATVLIGDEASGVQASGQMEMETADIKMTMAEIDGFQVHTVFEKKEMAGTIMIGLTRGEEKAAVLVFTFEQMTAGEALKLARRFDWKALRKAALAVK